MINIYEHRKTCIFFVSSLVKPTSVLKLSGNFLKIWSWNFTSCCWEPCKQQLVHIRTLYSHNRKQAQAAVRQETTESLRSWSELFMCCVVLNTILFTTSHVSIYQLLMLVSVIYFSVTISYS